MRLYPLAYIAGLLPLLTIHLTYMLSASHGQVPWCVPYIHSCTSISATGRLPPAYFVFKGLMVPAAVVLVTYWLLNARWLRQLGCIRRGWQNTLVTLGLLAGAGLIFYSVLLGSIPPQYRVPRHTGVIAFFGFTFFAQLLITWLATQRPIVHHRCPRQLLWLRVLIAIDLLVGLGTVILGFINPQAYDATNNAVAWSFTLLLCVHICICAELWRRTDFCLLFSTKL